MENNELKHYGVLGMKWGVRKAAITGKDYTYKSRAQKKWQKKQDKIDAKLAKGKKVSRLKQKKTADKLGTYKFRDKNRQDYAETTTVGKSIAKTIIFGPLGAGNYNRFRASGYGRIASALGSNYVASTLGYPITFALSKSAENRAGRNMGRLERELKRS